MPPAVNGIIETAIYVEDVERSASFYERVVGAERMSLSARLAAMSIAGSHVLLIFKKGGSVRPTVFPGGTIPANDADGQIHFAFSIPAEEFERWEAWLPEAGVEIESVVTWDRGGRSLYFRDPDGHNVELATKGIWPIY